MFTERPIPMPPLDRDWLPPSAYLVGGAVRDALLARDRAYLDLDFVLLEGAVETARQIARHYRAGFVVLDADRQIARVVFEQGTADFALAEGGSLETDLRRRDYTVNAIAYHPPTQQLFDPLGGLGDLERGTLKMVSASNLEDDPLRLLRAYRQASQLNFAIDAPTRETLRALAPTIANVAAERVQAELNYLLGDRSGNVWLEAARADGVLSPWLPGISRDRVRQVAEVDAAADSLCQQRSVLGEYLARPVAGRGRSWRALAKLAALVGSEQAEAQLVQLKYSRAEVKAASKMLAHLPSLLAWEERSPSVREQYGLFQDLGEVVPGLVVLAIAAGSKSETILPLLDRYLDPDDPVAHPVALVSGNELMRSLSLPPSAAIGMLLTEIQIARAQGQIDTPSEALAYAASLLKSGRIAAPPQ